MRVYMYVYVCVCVWLCVSPHRRRKTDENIDQNSPVRAGGGSRLCVRETVSV